MNLSGDRAFIFAQYAQTGGISSDSETKRGKIQFTVDGAQIAQLP